VERATPCEKSNSNRKRIRAMGKKVIVIKRRIIPIKKEQ
jgi:hypothetical protein